MMMSRTITMMIIINIGNEEDEEMNLDNFLLS